MDGFVQNTGAMAQGCDASSVMDYFDGNTVTAMWNYAQHFALSDNTFGSTFGESTVGALNLASGQTHGAIPSELPMFVANGTLVRDADPALDDCSKAATAQMTSRTIGDALLGRGVALVRGRLRQLRRQSPQHRRCRGRRLHPPPPTVPVLRLDREPPPPP